MLSEDKEFMNVGHAPVVITVKDMYDTPDASRYEKRIFNRNGVEEEVTYDYPYTIQLADAHGVVIVEEKSSAQRFVKDWSRRFYTRESEGKDGKKRKYLGFSRGYLFLALIKLYESVMEKDFTRDTKASTLIGFSFPAVVKGKDDNRFIDWVETFRLNEVYVPEFKREDEFSGDFTMDEVAKKNEEGGKTSVDDLPF